MKQSAVLHHVIYPRVSILASDRFDTPFCELFLPLLFCPAASSERPPRRAELPRSEWSSMLLDIGPIGDGRASDDPLGLKHGLEQGVTEKRQQLALQVDSLGQYDGRLLLHEVEESAADGASVAAGGDSGGGGLDAGGDGVDGNSDGVAAAGATKEEMEARLRQERRDLMLTLRKTDIGYLQRESFGKTMLLIERANQVDDVKRSSQGEVPGSRLLEAEGALMEGRSQTSPLPGRRSSGGTLLKMPSANSLNGRQAAADAAAGPPVPKRRIHNGPDSPKGRGRRSSRGTLPEGTPPVSSLSREQCVCRDPSGRGAAASAAPSHRAAPGLAVCASHTSTGPPSSALISPSPQAAPGAAPSRQDLRVALGLTPSQRADLMPLPPSAVPPPKVAEGSWRELCTYSAPPARASSAPVAQKASSAPLLKAGSLSTAPPAQKARSLSTMAERRDPSKITGPSAVWLCWLWACQVLRHSCKLGPTRPPGWTGVLRSVCLGCAQSMTLFPGTCFRSACD